MESAITKIMVGMDGSSGFTFEVSPAGGQIEISDTGQLRVMDYTLRESVHGEHNAIVAVFTPGTWRFVLSDAHRDRDS